jgi:hypothetical protein
MMLTRLAVGLEPLNALDAAHRSPQSVFGIGSPADPALAGSLSETKNCWKFEINRGLRQIGQSRARYYLADLSLLILTSKE